jgi:hypothetical protein
MEEKILNKLFERLDISEFNLPIVESSGLTYYELRKLITMIYRQAKGETKKVLADILKIVTNLEIKKKPVPMIKKLANNSAEVFED